MSQQRAFNAILGALVADTASMGFHWLYDQTLIKKYTTSTPEFHAPNQDEYEGKGYFAHKGKAVGSPSQYGAQLTAMLASLSHTQPYSESRYIASFRTWFDFGGQWQGYIDKPTKIALLAMHQEEVSIFGADDTQNPAISKLPALVAYHYKEDALPEYIESAVRVTNNNDIAVKYAQAVAIMIKMAINGHTVKACIEEAKQSCSFIKEEIEKAEQDRKLTSLQVAEKVGLHCGLDASFIVVMHILLTATSYEEAIQTNIYCGGDNCGRAIPLGAILGACFTDSNQAIPSSWIEQSTLPNSLLARFLS